MRIIRGPHCVEKLAMDGASSDIVDGALLTYGVTDETNRSCAIISGAAAADVIGVKLGIHDFSVVGDTIPEDGTAYVEGDVDMFLPGAICAGEHSLAAADDVAVTSATGTVITITSLEDDIDGSFIYVTVGTGVGQLEYLEASASGNCTVKDTMTTTLDSTSSIIKLLTFGKRLHVLTSDRSKFATTDAVGTAEFQSLYVEGKWQGSQGWERLNPTKHAGLELNGLNPAFRVVGAFIDTWFNPLT